MELSEIEAHVRSHSIVDDCYVTLFDLVDASHEGSEKRIVAHVVFKKDVQQGKGATNDWKQVRLFGFLVTWSQSHQDELSPFILWTLSPLILQ